MDRQLGSGAARAASHGGFAFGAKVRWTLAAGNLLGALVTFVYFSVIDRPLGQAPPGLRTSGVLFFAVGMAFLSGAGFWLGLRWVRPVAAWMARAPADRANLAPLEVRQRLLMMPWQMARIAFVGWVLAGVIFGVGGNLLSGTFTPARALRAMFGITVVAGSVTTAFIFLVTEHMWRRRLPAFFPHGDLSAVPGVLRLGVLTRLLATFALISAVPLAVLGVQAYGRAAAMAGADAAAAEALLQGMGTFILFMLAIGGIVAVGLAVLVARSVARPLGDLEAAMREVGRGNLDVRCPVVSTDEIGAVTEGFNRMLEGLRERERIRETFGKYVTREVRDEILSGRVSLGGRRREVTLLFSDLRDFTPWVEAHAPEAVVRDLNDYFTLMEGAIRAHGGLVIQYIGDEIEAVFGAPLPDPRHAEQAVRAALEMRARLAAWNGQREAAGRPLFRHGIGIHTGEVLAGAIGSPDRLSYALVGDAVNLASRLQDLTKEMKTDVVVSGATQRRLGASVETIPCPAVRVKGKSAEVEVFRIP
jgi:class 3 adenylate cyclase